MFINDIDTDSDTKSLLLLKVSSSTLIDPKTALNFNHTSNYNQQHLVTFLQVTSKHQILNEDGSSLIQALEKKNPTIAYSEVSYNYNKAFITHSFQILWIIMKSVD